MDTQPINPRARKLSKPGPVLASSSNDVTKEPGQTPYLTLWKTSTLGRDRRSFNTSTLSKEHWMTLLEA